MQCPGCGNEVPAAAKFCLECGRPQLVECATCRAPVPANAKFCGECGTPTAAAIPTQPAEGPQRVPGPVAERRVCSVLFGDLVGFTPLSESRDPEEVRELLSRYFEAARTVIGRYGGTVEKFIGDAVMAVWGVPTSHEDDAERAVRAAIDLLDRVQGLAEETGLDLSMRVGVVTGEVAVTLGADAQGMVAGDAVNTAARVQAAAAPGAVWVDDVTRSLTAAAVSYVDVGEHVLKGKAAPVRLYQARAVVAAVGGAQRVDGLEAAFTGRDRELRMVKELFEATVEDTRSRFVLVSGVAGMGKSRLGWEFEKYVDGLQGVVMWHRGRCLSYGEGVAFWALAEMVRARLGLTEGDPEERLAERLAEELVRLVPDEQERQWLGPRVAVLLGTERHRFPREDVFSAWTVFFERVWAGSTAVVLLIEDLQYADDGLLDFLDHALGTARFPLYVLGLARPELVERRPDIGTGRRKTTIHLEPLSDQAMGRLVEGLVEGVPAQTRSALIDRAEGVPLYAVETVRALIDRDAVVPRDGRYVLADDAADRVDLLSLDAPASLHALVSSRLDTLDPAERALVQDAAVLGLSFSRDALVVLREDVSDLDRLLAVLVRKEIVQLQTDQHSAERGQYRFVQAVVRQVAYDTLARRDRKSRHLAVAQYLATEPDPAGDLAAVIAQHYLDAVASSATGDDDVPRLVADAQALLERAAQRAMSLGAPAEAYRHYTAALRLPLSEGTQARLDEGAAAAASTMADWPNAVEHAARATAVHDAAGRVLDAARTAAVIGRALMQQQLLTAAVELLTPRYQALEREAGADEVLLVVAEILGQTHNYLGETAVARGYVERMLLIAEAIKDTERVVLAMTHWSNLWIVGGMPVAGRAVLARAVELARQLPQPTVLIRPLVNTAAFHAAQDLGVALAAGQEAMALAQQTGNRPMESLAAVNVVMALWSTGRWEDARELTARRIPEEIDRGALATLYAARLWIAAATGDEVGELPEPLVQLVSSEDLQGRAWALSAQAASLLRPEEQAERAHLGSRAARASLSWSGTDDDFVYHWSQAVEAALAAPDQTLAADLFGLVESRPPGLVSPYAHAELMRLRGQSRLAAGDTAGGEADLRAAISELTALGTPFRRAQAELALAAHLAGRGSTDEAAVLRESAEQIFVSLGAAPWLHRLHDLVPRTGPAVSTTV